MKSPQNPIFVRALCTSLLLGTVAPSIHAENTFSKEPSTFARYVPERRDDFAWENDLIAFRAYGPALRGGAENNGFDAWLKRVDYPIVDKWYYENANGKSYHFDHGEGLDNYTVGASAGVGGTGIWMDGKRRPLETYVEHAVHAVTAEESRFTLSYEETIDGSLYREEKTITIRLGERVFHVESIFYKDGKVATNLPICIGLTLRNGGAKPLQNKDAGWIATWGSHHDTFLGTGVLVNPEIIGSIEVLKTDDKSENHIFLITETDEVGKISYAAGYGWSKAGDITTQAAWESYLSTFR